MVKKMRYIGGTLVILLIITLSSCSSGKVRDIKNSKIEVNEKIIVGEIRVFHILPPTFIINNKLRADYDFKDVNSKSPLDTFLFSPWKFDSASSQINELQKNHPDSKIILDSIMSAAFITKSNKMNLSIYQSIGNQAFSSGSSNTGFDVPSESILETFDISSGKIINMGRLSIIVQIVRKDPTVSGSVVNYRYSYRIEKDDTAVSEFEGQYPSKYAELKDDVVLMTK